MFYNLVEAQRLLASSILQVFESNTLFDDWTVFGAARKYTCNLLKEHPKPVFNVGIEPVVVMRKPFCNLLNFPKPGKPTLLIFAPLSGHHATLLNGTVAEFVKDYNVYITDWIDASAVSVEHGEFGFSDYVEYSKEFIKALNGPHLLAICQPGVPVVAALALLGREGYQTKSLTLMGSPIDTRLSPTKVNEFADQHDMDWFRQNVIHTVPVTKAGFGRKVYPGFIQLSGFMMNNLERHMQAYRKYFNNLLEGNEKDVKKHEEFYDEYLSVLDMDAKFYLETIEYIFKEYLLPEGKLYVGDELVEPIYIECPVLCVEGEKDDITGIGQTKAVLDLVSSNVKQYSLVPGVGHYGLFNGKHFQGEIAPMVRDFHNKI